MICPDCEGQGQIQGFACPGFRPIVSPCGLCQGAGDVSAEVLASKEDGETWRTYRVGIYLNQRQMAELQGITPQELSKMEAGLLPLTEKMREELGLQRVAAAVLDGLAKDLQKGK